MLDGRWSDEELLERIGAIGRELAEADGLEATLQRIVHLGVSLHPRCDGGSLMLLGRGGGTETPAFTSDVAYETDLAQYLTGQGPCLAAIEQHDTAIIDDLETDSRWPEFRAKALSLGVRSMLSCRLFITDDSLGALNLYASQPHVFDQRSALLGQVFASQASVAMKAALIETGLQIALQSRDVIGQAKGIVMAKLRLTADMAFQIMVRSSQDRNVKLTVVAEEIARTGVVPTLTRS